LLWLFWSWDLVNCFSRLSSNYNPPMLESLQSLARIIDMSHQCLAKFLSFDWRLNFIYI
jgi:hypothetical protein